MFTLILLFYIFFLVRVCENQILYMFKTCVFFNLKFKSNIRHMFFFFFIVLDAFVAFQSWFQTAIVLVKNHLQVYMYSILGFPKNKGSLLSSTVPSGTSMEPLHSEGSLLWKKGSSAD